MKKFFSSDWGFVAVALVLGALVFIFSERMQPFGMLGDENLYFLVSYHFPKILTENVLTDYYTQRILPSGLVHYTLKALSIQLNLKNIMIGFGVYNVALMGLLAWIWCKIGKRLKLSTAGKWLGFVALFGNYAVLKFIPYTVVTTDMFGYFFGLTLFYFYLCNWPIAIALLTLVGSFAWPTVIYMGSILLVFPRDQKPVEHKKAPWHLNDVAAAAVCLFLCWPLYKFIISLYSGHLMRLGIFTTGANAPLSSVIYLSIAIMLAYVFFSIRLLLNHGKLFNIRYLFSQIHIVRWIFAVAIFVFVKWSTHALAGKINSFPIDYVLFNMVSSGVIQPGTFLVAHVSYWGAFIALFVFFWPQVVRVIQDFGLGYVLCALLIVGHSIHSESRLMMNFYPILLPALIIVLDRAKITKWQWGGVLLLAVASSKIWAQIHGESWNKDPFEFPSQWYFMNFGQHMSHKVYAIKMVILVIAAVYLFYVFVKRRELIRG